MKIRISILLFLLVVSQSFSQIEILTTEQVNDLINNPFSFPISIVIDDDFSYIGEIESDTFEAIEPIGKPGFTFFRNISFDGLKIRISSRNETGEGFARYEITNPDIVLNNRLSIGATRDEVLDSLGAPWYESDDYVSYTSDEWFTLYFEFENNRVVKIVWYMEL